MAQTSPIPTQQIPHELRLSAAERLVSAPGRRDAARRLIASASSHGIDLELMWGVVEPVDQPSSTKKNRRRVRQVVLAVPGSGRTAMLFLSNPDPEPALGTHETQSQEISASISTCLDGLSAWAPDRVALAQALVETDQTWAHRACIDAGMICVGTLDYMRKPITDEDLNPIPIHWPDGIEVRPLRTLQADRALLIEALEGSYQQTLDCPELCGLRPMDDVVDSHLATGVFAAHRWHLIFKDARPAGCCLLTHCPENNSVELVYLGIAPQARGLGLGKRVLDYAIRSLDTLDIDQVTCAVDNRNAPAISVYKSLGFARFDARVGFVSQIQP